MTKRCLIMAGGTGGHVFPGIAVADTLVKRGWHIDWLGTAERMEAQVVPQHGYPIHFIPVKGLRGKGIQARLSGVWALFKSLIAARKLVRTLQPDVVLGMGGYASGPGGLAAWSLGIPVIVHEQNAVPGMTNRLLGKVAKRIMLGFDSAKTHFGSQRQKCVTAGNPVRKAILDLPVKSTSTAPLNMLVVGGSLGARPLNENIPALCKNMPGLAIWHQSGKGNAEAVKQAYGNTEAKVTEFIDDMAEAYQWADFIVCRAGALTVAEVAAAGKAAIFVPLPHAVDDHQTQNARSLADNQAAELVPQSALTDKLPGIIQTWINDPQACEAVAMKAKQFAPHDAAGQVADACEYVVTGE